jgi:hypothetical protein
MKETGDHFDRKFTEFNAKYEAQKNTIPLRADTDRDGTPDSMVESGADHFLSVR